jgi:sugar-specific transcriptional regulator TrmB
LTVCPLFIILFYMSSFLTDIEQILIEFGFRKNEIDIFVSLTRYGSMTVLEISRNCDVPRTSIYNYLQSLLRKNLVIITIDNYIKKYQAIEPESLENILIKSKHSSIQKAVQSLKTIQNSKNQSNEIEIYKGLDSLKIVYTSILKSKDKSKYRVKGGDDKKWRNLDREFFGNFEIQRGVLFKDIKCLLNRTNRDMTIKPNNMNTKILPVEQNLTSNMILVDNTMIIHELEPPYKCIVIRNEILYKIEDQEFELIWSLL